MKEKPSYWAQIPAEVRYDKKLPPNAKLLYGEISTLAHKDGFCWASNKYFSELYEVSESTVSVWIKQLSDSGYITPYVNQSDGNSRKIYIGLYKNLKRSLEKSKEGSLEKSKDNNTSINNIYNTTENKFSDTIFETFEELKIIFKQPNARFDTYKNTIKHAFRKGFSKEQIIAAAKALAASPYHQGENSSKTVYAKISFLFGHSNKEVIRRLTKWQEESESNIKKINYGF